MNIGSLIRYITKIGADSIGIMTSRERLLHTLGSPLYRNALYLMLNSGSGAILAFVFWIVAARFYPTEDIGIASALIAAVGLTNILSLFGLNVGMMRYLPRAENKRAVVNSSLTLVAIGAAVVAAIFVAGLPVWSPALTFVRENFRLVVLFIVFAVGSAVFVLQSQTFIAARSAHLTLIQQLGWHTSKLVMLLPLSAFGAMGIFAAYGATLAAAFLLANVLLLRRVLPGYRFTPVVRHKVVGEMLSFSLGNYVAETIAAAPRFILPLMVINLLGAESSAFFRISYGIAAVLTMISTAVNMSLFAEGSHAPEHLRATVIKAVKFMAILFVPALTVIMLAGDKILLIYGQEYSESGVTILRYLSIAALPYAVNELYVVANRVMLRVKPVIVISSLLAVLTLGCAYAFGSRFGLAGIGIGWLVGQSAVAVFAGWFGLTRLARQNGNGAQPTSEPRG